MEAVRMKEYPFKYPHLGEALVIGNTNFNRLDNLLGVRNDVRNLSTTFEGLGFHVTIKEDLFEDEMQQAVRDFSQRHHTYTSCVVIAIASHGGKRKTNQTHLEGTVITECQSFICGRDYREPGRLGIPNGVFLNYFSEENCPQLKGKPKIFFFDCCRGGELMKVVTIQGRGRGSESVIDEVPREYIPVKIFVPGKPSTDTKEGMVPDLGISELSIQHDAGDDNGEVYPPVQPVKMSGRNISRGQEPAMSGSQEIRSLPTSGDAQAVVEHVIEEKSNLRRDFIVVWGSPSGYPTYERKGGFFTTHLCKVLTEQHEEKDLLTMLTEVASGVASENINVKDKDSTDGERYIRTGQVSETGHMLLRKIFFKSPSKTF